LNEGEKHGEQWHGMLWDEIELKGTNQNEAKRNRMKWNQCELNGMKGNEIASNRTEWKQLN
jgi:hypothetical protein